MRLNQALIATSASLLALVPLASGGQPSLEGDWAGWLYARSGGDMPIQFSFERNDAGELEGTLSAPAQEAFDLDLIDIEVDVDGDRLTMTRVNSNGARLEYVASIAGSEMTGETSIDGEIVWDFQARRSDLAIDRVPPETLRNVPGVYRTDDGRTIVISSWFWGELIYQDNASGRRSTLFASGPDSLFAGPRMYTPSPVDLRIDIERNEQQGAQTLLVRHGEADPVRATRTEMVVEPVTFESDEATLTGEIRRPAGDGPFPGVVVIPGSDWSTRNGATSNADLFVAMGLATLTFDKRGHGDSEGERDVAYAQIARDLLAAHRTLASDQAVQSSQVGLFGVSRGGWHVPLAASMSDDVAFSVVFVAPAISPEAQERTRRLNVLKDGGAGPEDIQIASAYLDLQFEFGATGEGWDEYLEAYRDIERRGWLDILGGDDSPDERIWRWARLNMRYDPIPAIESLRAPILVVLGGADENVVPEDNAPLWREALERAPTDDYLIHVVPGANHGLTLVPEDGETTPLHLRPGSATGVWTLVEEWVTQRDQRP